MGNAGLIKVSICTQLIPELITNPSEFQCDLSKPCSLISLSEILASDMASGGEAHHIFNDLQSCLSTDGILIEQRADLL